MAKYVALHTLKKSPEEVMKFFTEQAPEIAAGLEPHFTGMPNSTRPAYRSWPEFTAPTRPVADIRALAPPSCSPTKTATSLWAAAVF